MFNSFRDARDREIRNKNKLLDLFPHLSENSGIYIMFREENGIKYAYVGQAKHILTRLAQHLVGYQHIDLSIKKHGLFDKDTPHGWNITTFLCSEGELDEKEREWIKIMASKGYQLRNHSIGGQGVGKGGLDNNKSPKGYRDGVIYGRRSLARELRHIIDTHLDITVKKDSKISEKALEKFKALLNYGNEGDNE